MNSGDVSDKKEWHPKLKSSARLLKLLPLLFLVVGMAICGAFALRVISTPPVQGGGLLLAITVIVMALGFFVTRRLVNERLLSKLETANRLLLTISSRNVRATPLGIGDFQGFLVELTDPARPDAPPSLALARPLGRRFLKKEPRDMELFLDSSDPQAPLVLCSKSMTMVGSMADAAKLAQGRSFHIQAFAASVILLLAVLTLFFFLQQSDIAEARETMVLAEASMEWPRARGVVLESFVEEVRIKRGKGTVQGFAARIVYEYSVDRNRFFNDLIHFGYSPGRDESLAQTLVDLYPVGADVNPAHDPANPQLAVLDPGHVDVCGDQMRTLQRNLYLVLGGGAVGVVGIMVLGWFTLRRRQRVLDGYPAYARDAFSP